MTYSLMKSSPKVEVDEKAGPHTPSMEEGAEEAVLDRRLRGDNKSRFDKENHQLEMKQERTFFLRPRNFKKNEDK